MPELSVVVITLNEAANIDDALESVAWANEIIVVDSGSTDDTVARARRHTDRVSQRNWTGYGAQKDHAAQLAAHDWVLSLDADERVSPGLATEITSLLRQDPPHGGYRIPRATWYMGRWIRTTAWYPDLQLRLYDRRVARWSSDPVHESVRVDGRVGRLRHELRHYAYRDLSGHLTTIDRYTTLAAQQMLDAGRRPGPLDLPVYPPVAFLRNYLLQRGCLQGIPGFVVSVMNAYYVFLKYAKLRELRDGQHGGSDERDRSSC